MVDGDEPGAELDPDGQVVDWLEPLVCELQEQAALAHAGVPDDDILEQVRVAHFLRISRGLSPVSKIFLRPSLQTSSVFNYESPIQ